MHVRRVLAAVAAVTLAFSSIHPVAFATVAAADEPANCVPNPKPTAAEADVLANVEYVTGNQIRITYETDGASGGFSVNLRGTTGVVDATGFTNESGVWVWDGETRNPSITYEAVSISSDDWGSGVFLTPEHPNTTVNITAKNGAVSRELMYVGGAYHTTTVSNGCEDIQIIVPCGVSVHETVADVADTIKSASENLHVGHRWDTATVFAVEDVRSFGILGVYFGEGDMAVRADLEADTPGNTWVHEYVHSRQGWNMTTNMTWLTEGSAEYYAARLSLNQNLITTEQYNDHIGEGVNSETILSQPDTWGAGDNYQKGALVLAALDKRIRSATNGEKSLETVLRRVNAMSGHVNYTEFRGIVANVAGEDVARWTDKYVTTSQTPDYHRESTKSRSAVAYYYAKAMESVDEWVEYAENILNPAEPCSRAGYII